MSEANETKRAAFVRLAEARTNKILAMVKLLGNLSSKATYEYTKSDYTKIFKAIRGELDKAESRFTGHTESEGRFKL